MTILLFVAGVSNGVCSILGKKVIHMEFNNAEKDLNISNLHVRREFLDVRDAVVAYDILFEKGIPGIEYITSSGKFKYLKDLTDALRLYSSVEFGLRTLNNHIEVDPLKPNLMKNLVGNLKLLLKNLLKTFFCIIAILKVGSNCKISSQSTEK